MTIYVKRRELSDDELMHWKYLKKVRTTSGKWRYVYDLKDLEKYDDDITLAKKLKQDINRKIRSSTKLTVTRAKIKAGIDWWDHNTRRSITAYGSDWSVTKYGKSFVEKLLKKENSRNRIEYERDGNRAYAVKYKNTYDDSHWRELSR